MATLLGVWWFGIATRFLEWAFLGYTIFIVFIFTDIFLEIFPNSLPYQPIFTNIRDTIVVIGGLLIGSAVVYSPEWIGNTSFWVRGLSHLLGAAVFLAIVFFLGTSHLKENLWKKQTKHSK